MRLVSFGASAALAIVVFLAVASLRYVPMGRPQEASRVAVVSEVLRAPPPQPEARRPPERAPERQAASDEQPSPAEPPSAEPSSEPVVITAPVWVERPRNPERFYPRQAFMRGTAGEVVLDCNVDTSGRMACVVVSETPPEQGFAEAALRIAGAHMMRPAMRNEIAVRGRYRMIVPFSPSG